MNGQGEGEGGEKFLVSEWNYLPPQNEKETGFLFPRIKST